MITHRNRQMTTVVCLFLCLGCLGHAQGPSRRYRPAPHYVQIGTPDQAEGKRILEQFRQQGLYSGECYFDFELRVMPRRGEDRSVPGRLWVTRNELGPISRIVVAPGVVDQEVRLLVQNGPEGAVWGWRSAAQPTVERLSVAALFEALAASDVTAFDLQMQFLYWPEFVFEGVSKVRGRPAHTFLLYPSADVIAHKPELTGVRVYLDTQYGQPVQAEYIGPEGKALKTVTVVELKIIDKQPIVKSVDFRDDATRNKSRFSVTAAAVGLELAESIFQPGMLAESIHLPPTERIQKVGP